MSHTTTETRGTQTNATGRTQSRFERRGSKHPWGFAPPAPRDGRTEGVAARPHESHNEYRNRVGRTTRYVHLRNQQITPWQRAKEIEEYHRTVARVENKMIGILAEARAKSKNSFREKQAILDAPKHAEQRKKAAKTHADKMEHDPECRAEYGHKGNPDRLAAMDHMGPRDLHPSEVVG